jgi:hypothetical protein
MWPLLPSGRRLLCCAATNGGVLVALPVVPGRVRREPLMTTPLDEIEATPEWNRALCAWMGWLAWAINRRR